MNLPEYCVGDIIAVRNYPLGASPYGVLDMAGNVWERLHDWWQHDYYSVSPESNPQGPLTGSYRVVAGAASTTMTAICAWRTATSMARSIISTSSGSGVRRLRDDCGELSDPLSCWHGMTGTLRRAGGRSQLARKYAWCHGSQRGTVVG